MIYLDNAATTRPNSRAVLSANPYLQDEFFNPSALYRGGERARAELKSARAFLLAQITDGISFDLTFTSCGTEADNQAIFCAGRRGNVVTTAGEHAAVYASCVELKNRGVEPRFAPLLPDGRVNVDALLSIVDEKTSLVSVIHVNNETGAVNPVCEIAKRVKQKNPRCVFHSDGVQAFGKIPVRLSKEIDLYAISAHKIGGLKGVGALVHNKAYRALTPHLHGGGQEGNLRSGTENVFGISAFYHAAEEKFHNFGRDGEKVKALREKAWEGLDKEQFIRISPEDGTPYILTVSAVGKRGAVLQQALSGKEIYIGTGSACSSKKPFSRVIEACGYEKEVLYGVIRLSFSPETTEEEVVRAVEAMNVEARNLTGGTF